MLTELCAVCRNWFTTKNDIHFGVFTIQGGKISPLDFTLEDQYFRIVGSHFNDGVYKNTESLALKDEVFRGQVWAMRVPPAFVALAGEIEDYCNKNAVSPYTSESFGGYSYSKATNESNIPMTWQEIFAAKLKEWRKM